MPKKRKRHLKIALLVDPMGTSHTTPEEEIEDHKHVLTDMLGDKCRILRFYTPACPIFEPNTDMVLYDFGGLLPGSDDLLDSNARALVRFAQDNPNCLILVVSTMSPWFKIEEAMEDLGIKRLPNVVASPYRIELPDWFLEGIGE